MEIQTGQKIETADRQEVGPVRGILVEQATGRVAALVVDRGLLARAVEVPLERLALCEDGRVRLALPASGLEALRPFDAERYARRSEPAVYAVPGVLWPGAHPAPGLAHGAGFPAAIVAEEGIPEAASEEAEVLQILDQAYAVLEPDDPVVDIEGARAGSVERIILDVPAGRIVGVEMRRGFLGGPGVRIPADQLAGADDHVLYLRVSAEEASSIARREDNRPD